MKIKFSKRFVSLLLAILIMITGIPFDQMGVVWANDLGNPWDGVSVQKPEEIGYEYQIDSAEELAWFAQEVNSGNDFDGKSIYITGNINLNKKDWFVIGNGTIEKPSEINADIIIENTVISGLEISDSRAENKGLFGAVRLENITVNNLKIENANIIDNHTKYDGFLFGSLELKKDGSCTINNCTLGGTVSGTSHCGAFAGNVEAVNRNAVISITNSDMKMVSTSYGYYIGDKVNSDCKGGMIGRYNSSANTKLILNGIYCDLDLAAYNESGYWSACAGGMIGVLSGSAKVYVYQCAVTGKILSSGYCGWGGGIVGRMEGCDTYRQSDCYVTAEITSYWNAYGYQYNAAGFIGGITGKKPTGFIRNSYYAGNSNTTVAFISMDQLKYETQLKIYNSYYDLNKIVNHVFHSDSRCFEIHGTAVDCAAYTTAQMGVQGNYVGWDFDNVWVMGNGYPELRRSNFALPVDFWITDDSFNDSLNQFLNAVLTDKGNVSTIKYLCDDENFMNSMFVHENDGKFSAGVVMTVTNMFYRGMDGWKDLFNGETAKQQAEELLANLLYDFQDECEEVANAKTAKKFSEALTSGAEYFMEANAIESSFSNEDIKNLNDALSPEVLGLVFKKNKYNYLENYLTVVKGYSSDDKLVKLLHNYLRSDEIIKSYKDNFKYLGDGIDIISMTNDTIRKLYEVDVLYNSNELYSEMLLYLKENCKYSIVCDAADELYTVVNGSYKEQLRYVSETLMNKMEDKLVDVAIDNLLDTTIAKMNYAFIIKEGFDWGVKISNFVWHTGDAQEQRDKMRSLAYIGNCLSQWMLDSNIEYFKAIVDEEKQALGLRTYYAAYMLWQTRKAGEDALQGYAKLQGLTFRRWYRISKSISETLDSLENTMFTENNKAKLLTLTIACPVDVEISDNSGNIIAQIADGSETQYFSKEIDYAVVYDPISKDYIKIIHLCDENEYKVRCIGNDLGQVDLNMMQITEDGKTKMKYVDDMGVEKQTTIEWIPLSNDSKVQVKNGNELKTYDLVESDDTYIPLKNVSFVSHNLEMQQGEKLRLDKVITPLDASDKLFCWTSDNASCVDVNNDGVVYGIAVGQASITISSLDGTLLDRCVIIVTEDHAKDNNSSDTSGTASGSGGSTSESNDNISGSSVDGKSDMGDNTTLPESNPEDTEKTEIYNIVIPSKKLAVGKRIKLALVNGKNTIENSHVKWVVDNKKYATVNSQGVLICKKKGIGKTVVITANSEGGKNVLATVKIKIMKHAVTRVRIKAAQKKMKAGEQLRLQAIIETSGVGANKKLKWISSNSKYASVNSKGIVTAKTAGKGKVVTITAQATDGSNKKQSLKIRVLSE